MNNYREILAGIALHALFATPVFALAYWRLATVDSGLVAAGQLLIGMALMLLGAVILGWPIARLLAESWGSIYYSSGRFDRPQPIYSIPAANAKKGLFEEAIAGYERIAEEYPSEVKPYIEMIEIAVVHLRNADRATRIYRTGLATLTEAKDRNVLSEMYAGIITLLHPAAEEPQAVLKRRPDRT